MYKTYTTRSTFVRFARFATASAALALLAACGGGGDDNNNSAPPGGIKLQVVSFGDSLSDAGTYSPVAARNFGGGRFTTNPGQVWTQDVAQYYGDTLTPAATGGFGVPLTAAPGFGYAQGGARVKLQPGIGHAPAGTPNADYAQATTIPVNDQVSSYLAAHGSFNANQLVLINGGANDILLNLSQAQAAAAAAAAGQITPAQALAAANAAQQAIGQAAIDLASVIGRVVQAGATHVVVSTVPNIGGSPQGLLSSDKGVALTKASQGFNLALQGALTQAGLLSKVIYVDVYSWIDGVTANFQSLGFTVSNTGTACNLQSMIANATASGQPNPSAFGTSLFCSPQTYTVAGADQSYMYADTLHPTTHLYALYAQNVEQAIAKSGLGK
ncbi:phospholipase/lecithinase/hemolysin [Paraburkholderia sp. BL8N3]|jgi:phospholipase/lecithinase/hemolysin|nr:phospholipase/lecithinase/hemolysin [Paraburkholderia sp. BL8N3]